MLLLTVTGGCSSYYVVKQPGSDLLYCTRDIDHVFCGALKFKDDRTGSEVTLQNSDVKEINESEYNMGKYSSK